MFNNILKSSLIKTTLGSMIAIADEKNLHLLEFVDRINLEKEIKKLKIKTNSTIIEGINTPIESINIELKAYFAGKLKQFKTPFIFSGTAFQILVWQELISIPYAQIRSYMNQAKALGKDKAYRAVANANAANQLAIIIPCHRIINTNGDLGGYAAGLTRKKWLIEHEKAYI